jgi:hypothetical protein
MLMGEFIVMSGSFFVLFALWLCCLHAADDVSNAYSRNRRKIIRNERNKRVNRYRGKMK